MATEAPPGPQNRRLGVLVVALALTLSASLWLSIIVNLGGGAVSLVVHMRPRLDLPLRVVGRSHREFEQLQRDGFQVTSSSFTGLQERLLGHRTALCFRRIELGMLDPLLRMNDVNKRRWISLSTEEKQAAALLEAYARLEEATGGGPPSTSQEMALAKEVYERLTALHGESSSVCESFRDEWLSP